jgi:hypothetical protein
VTVTVPSRGEWYVYVRDAAGNVTDLGPLSPGSESKFEIVIPPGSAGGQLLITDEAEVPTERSYDIVSSS